jgi:hypothetical protein
VEADSLIVGALRGSRLRVLKFTKEGKRGIALRAFCITLRVEILYYELSMSSHMNGLEGSIH